MESLLFGDEDGKAFYPRMTPIRGEARTSFQGVWLEVVRDVRQCSTIFQVLHRMTFNTRLLDICRRQRISSPEQVHGLRDDAGHTEKDNHMTPRPLIKRINSS